MDWMQRFVRFSRVPLYDSNIDSSDEVDWSGLDAAICSV